MTDSESKAIESQNRLCLFARVGGQELHGLNIVESPFLPDNTLVVSSDLYREIKKHHIDDKPTGDV